MSIPTTSLEKAQAALRDRNRLYERVFTTEDGADVLKHIESESFVHHTTLTRPTLTAAIDPIESAYREGMRAVPLRIRRYIELAKKPEPEVQTQAVSRSVETIDERATTES